MLTLIKLFFYKLESIKMWGFVEWVRVQHWYLIKFRKARHFKIDLAMTKKFFRWTYASFFVYRFFGTRLLILHDNFDFVYNISKTNTASIVYLVSGWLSPIEQLIDIVNVEGDQMSKWQLLDYFFLLEFPYIYDKIDRKERWLRWIKHIFKNYVLTLKYYSGKITALDGSD